MKRKIYLMTNTRQAMELPTGSEVAKNVITIESDSEDDDLIIQANRTVRLVPDRRVGRPRDALNRFVSPNTLSSADELRGASSTATSQQSTTSYNSDDEDLQIVRVSNPRTEQIPNESNPVELDHEPDYSSEMLSSHTRIDRRRSSDDLDSVTILEERSMRPRVALNLPGGRTLEINSRESDQPMRSSFENYERLPISRRRLLQRTARNANALFYHSDDDGETEDPDFEPLIALPRGVVNLRRQERMRQRQQELRRLRRQQGYASSIGLERVRSRISSLPLNVRSLYDHAGSLNEFSSMIDSAISSDHQRHELVELFSEYRNELMDDWARRRVRSVNMNSVQQNAEPSWIHSSGGTRFLSTYIMFGTGGLIPELHSNQWSDSAYRSTEEQQFDDDTRTQNIINMIQEREEREHDARTKNFMAKTKGQEDSFHQRANDLPDGYSASFDTKPRIIVGNTEKLVSDATKEELDSVAQYEDVPVCCLCGVELGVGIPESFNGISALNSGVSFECLVAKYKFHCPYQGLKNPSQLDRDLSKRTYVASCGHTFCGRCFARINNARSKAKMSRKKVKDFIGSAHPDNYGPKTCPAEGCSKPIRSKGKMKEVFF